MVNIVLDRVLDDVEEDKLVVVPVHLDASVDFVDSANVHFQLSALNLWLEGL